MWRNWTGEQACIPAVTAAPSSAQAVAEEIAQAAAAGRTVRVAGAGHSFTDAVLTDGTLLSLDAMQRVLDVDASTGLARVQAGIRLHQLSEELARHGRALENLGDINVQSIAGATATGTHGTGSELRNISSQIEAVQLVTADGEIREIDGGDELRAARVSVGALGVVTELTLRTVPLYTLRGVDEPHPLADVLGALDDFADGARHFEFYVFPHSDIALTRTNEIVDEPPQPPGPAKRWVEDVLLGNHGLRLACEAAKRFPRRIPTINRQIANGFSRRVRIDRADRIFSSPRLVRFTEMELAFPRDSDTAPAIVEEVLAMLARFPVVFPIEVRFVAPDDALISPAGGRPTMYVAVHNFRGMPWEAPLRAMQAIGERYGARPHWGKRHFHTAETLAPLYPEWETFQGIRAELDPAGRFANDYVRRTLIGQTIRDPSSPALR